MPYRTRRSFPRNSSISGSASPSLSSLIIGVVGTIVPLRIGIKAFQRIDPITQSGPPYASRRVAAGGARPPDRG